MIDEPGLVRLQEFLGGEPIEIEQYKGGHSNLTYALTLGGRELVLRRAPPGVKIKSAHDMVREHRILTGLSRLFDRVPKTVTVCADEGVIGSPFYVMERITGTTLYTNRHAEEAGIDSDTMRSLAENLVDTLAEIHRIDHEAAGLGDLGRPDGYVSRQVAGWAKRYANSKTDDIGEIETMIAWLDEHQPGEAGACVIHNDFKYDNVVLDPNDLTRIIGVLDWEMATIGDPLMDLGTSLGYWIDPDDPAPMKKVALGALQMPGNLTRREVIDRYAEASGLDVSNILFYYVYGLFKLCVIGQQLYMRFKKGLTDDARLGAMIGPIRVIAGVGALAIERKRIEGLG